MFPAGYIIAPSGHSESVQDQLDAIIAQTSLITSSNVVALVPFVNGTLNLIRNNDYTNSNGTAIAVTKPSGATWPTDLTGYTLTFTANINTDKASTTTPTTFSGTATVTQATGASQAFRLEFTDTNLNALALGSGAYDFGVKAVSGSIVKTLITGAVNVVKDPAVG